MFHTGWGSLWMKNNDRFNSGEPGIGLDAAKWVIEKDLALTAADTWAVEVVPNPDKSLAFAVHAELQTKHGILNHENLIFDELDRREEVPVRLLLHPVPDQGRHGKQRLPDRDHVTRSHWRVGGRTAHAVLRASVSKRPPNECCPDAAQHQNELLVSARPSGWHFSDFTRCPACVRKCAPKRTSADQSEFMSSRPRSAGPPEESNYLLTPFPITK